LSKFVPPHPDSEAFTCAYCGVYAQQEEQSTYSYGIEAEFGINGNTTSLYFKRCLSCKKDHLFLVTPNGTKLEQLKNSLNTDDKKSDVITLLYPKNSSAPPPQEDMPEEVLALYKEAASIVSDSPSAACLFIRKALETLLLDYYKLDPKKYNLDKLIKHLTDDTEQAWSKKFKPHLESIRLIGNDAAHPREINRADNEQTALTLFGFLNICVEHLISQPLKTKQFLEANSIPV
jgi:hypothetical protein